MRLRALELKDAELMLEWMKDEDLNRYFRFDADSVTLDSVKDYISKASSCESDKHYAIVEDDDIYLGTISLKNIDVNNSNAEYAVALRKVSIGSGIARAATLDILNKAFEMFHLNKVYLNVVSENKRAVRFYEKMEFTFEGEFVEHLRIRGVYHNLKWFAIRRPLGDK